MSLPKFTICIVCYNRLELTQRCIGGVMRHSANYELIVTDNASTDGTADYLKKLPGVTIITNDTNKGFKDPCNHALTLARGEYFVLLNNDMEVCPGWLETLAKPFTNHKVAITGIENTCRSINRQLVGSYGGPLEYIEGSCLMTPTALARKHGLFSDYLTFAYWEDTDYSLRMREAGYELATVPLAMHHHQRGSTSKLVPEVQQHMMRNTEVMKQKFGFYFKRRDLKRRILVRRLGAHGDVLLATPALKALRERYPQAELHVLTKCPSMLRGLDWLSVATRARSWYDDFYDLDLAYEKRPEVHVVQAFADALGVTVPQRWQLHMVANEEDRVWAARVARGARLALLHPGPTCWPGKNWVLQRFEELVGLLRGRGYIVATVGAKDAPNLKADLHLSGETTPQSLYALCREASLFVGIDSMPQHVASAADTPSVVLYGPTNPRALIRPTPRIVAVQADPKIVPCVGEHGRRTKPVTQAPCRGECMEAITLEMVMKAVERVERLVA